MADEMAYWELQRGNRLTERGTDRIRHAPSPFDGLIAWVAGEYIAGRELLPFLDVNAGDVSEGPWLGPDLVSVAYGGADDVVVHLARLRERIRPAAEQAGITDLRLAPHYALTGEPKATVPRGGSADAPEVATAIVATTWTPWTAGGGVVAVVDSGVDPASAWAGAVAGGADDDVLVVQGSADLGSHAGHGTFVASLVQRAAGGGAPLRAIQVLDVDGVTTEQDLVTGLARLRAEVAALPWVVVNLSLGGFTDNGVWTEIVPNVVVPPSAQDRVPLALAAELTRWADEVPHAVFVAAAGNDGQVARPFWPAALADPGREPTVRRPPFVAVASLDAGCAASGFTNRGDWVSIATLGEHLHGEYPHGGYVMSDTVTEQFQTGAARWSGTSFACALISGEIVRRARSGGMTAAQACSQLLTSMPANADADLGAVFDPRVSAPAWDPRLW